MLFKTPLQVREDVAVREHHALQVTGRARRVDERGEVVGLGALRQGASGVAARNFASDTTGMGDSGSFTSPSSVMTTIFSVGVSAAARI